MRGTCNLCGSVEWVDMNGRIQVRCAKCSSFERTRAIKLTLDRLGLPKKDAKILHFAPEAAMGGWLHQRCGKGYRPVDLEPERYPSVNTQKFDLIADSPALPNDYYDLIIHSHVLEHVPVSLGYLFHHLTRTLKRDGYHIFCLPMMSGYYDEYFGPLSDDDATKRFGQFDHVRRFGVQDIDRHLGAFIRLQPKYSLYDFHSKEELDACNIPESERQGLNGSTVFVTRKPDYRLQCGSEIKTLLKTALHRIQSGGKFLNFRDQVRN